ncbi:MAG TPA: hypothetical protein VGZ73_19200 [Bryobacteraceae bacterium]|jgi:hypothetical protein|nr:hypothetical protein [Bryobacteraceae bacterium]
MELRGWKQIAHYLGVTERTAQVWEQSAQMPVHHLPGPKGRVFAIDSELNAWKFGVRKTSDPPRKTITVRLPENSYERLRYVVSSSRAGTTLQKVISEVIGQYLERVG